MAHAAPRSLITYVDDFETIFNNQNNGNNHNAIPQWISTIRSGGYDATIISVARGGRSLYPSRYWQNVTSSDLASHIAQQLKYENVAFIPMIDFSAPLAPLEEIIARDPSRAQEILLTNAQGEILRQKFSPSSSRLPHYNLLVRETQEQVFLALAELTKLAAAHENFAGIAVQLSGFGYAQLPDETWGIDAETLARFLQETKITLDENLNPAQQAEIILRDHRETWLKWRCDIVKQFYKESAEKLAAINPQARIFLIGDEIFSRDAIQQSLTPTLPRRSSMHATLRRLGFDLRDDFGENIIFVRSSFLWKNATLAESSVTREIESDPTNETTFARTTASLFYENTISIKPFFPVAEKNEHPCARFARHLAIADVRQIIEGGTLETNNNPERQQFLREFRRIPDAPFLTFEPTTPQQPLVLRTANFSGVTWGYCINASSVPISAEITLTAPSNTVFSLEGRVTPLPKIAIVGTHSWQISLAPYSLKFFKLGERVELVDALVERATDSAEFLALKERVGRYSNNVRAAKMGIRCELLANEKFETTTTAGNTNGDISAWRSFGPASFTTFLGVPCQLNAEAKGISISMIQRESAENGGCGGIVSNSFSLPPTGRLFVLVQVGAPIDAPPPSLKFVLFAAPQVNSTLTNLIPPNSTQRNPIQHFQNFQHCVIASPQKGTEQIIGGIRWWRFVVPFENLPLENFSGGSTGQVQLVAETTQPGQVWLDDWTTYSVAFTPAEMTELMRRAAVASQRLEDGKLIALETALDGFWFQYLENLETHLPSVTKIEAAEPNRAANFPTWSIRNRTRNAEKTPAEIAAEKNAAQNQNSAQNAANDSPSFWSRFGKWMPF